MKPYRTYEEVKKRWMKNLSFKKEYEALRPKYEIIDAIIALRLEKGITQEALAKKVGTAQANISRVEVGKVTPTIDFLQKLAEALDAKLKITLQTGS